MISLSRLNIIITLIFISTKVFSQVGIGTVNPDASAILEMQSTNKGFLMPRMNTVQRDAIVNPANGLIIFNTTSECLNTYNSISTSWKEACGVDLFSIDCKNALLIGTLTHNIPAAGVSVLLTYTGSTGGIYSGQTISSSGVTGLTATLSAGSFSLDSGTLSFAISGTPSAIGSGFASFNFTIGSVSCTFKIDCTPCLVPGVGGMVWMCANLGATQIATSDNDPLAYGDLYQWGRETDGHQLRTSNYTGLAALSPTDHPGHSKFIVSYSGAPFFKDWRALQNDNLWQGVNGINNPCPTGMRIPTRNELALEKNSWSTNNSAGAFSNPLKWTLVGYRVNNNIASVSQAGSLGLYWSSTVVGADVNYLYLSVSNASFSSRDRGDGVSVRCIKN